MFDQATIAALMPFVKRMIGNKLPKIEISCPDKELHGVYVDGKFYSFKELEKELADFAI